jgi:predicted permease
MSVFPQFFDRLAKDLRYGIRMLLARPGFTGVAVMSIALGIAATTAIFSVVYAVLIDPYPYRAPDRIGQIILTTKKYPRRGVVYSKAQYQEIKARVHAVEDPVAVDLGQAVMTGTGPAEVVHREECSPNFFDFFGVPPLFGREFRAKDMPHGAAPAPVAVISYKFWQHAFQGSRKVLGRQIRLNDDVYTIIGVLPVRFTWNDADVYVPMDMRPSAWSFVQIFYRILPGVTQSQVQAEFHPLLEQFRRQMPPYMYPQGPFKVKFLTVNDGILGKFEDTLLALFGAVVLLLLIACANVANLLLARATAREGEMAIRVSIGATRLRLISQLLTESILLSLVGGAIGVALAYGCVNAVVALMPEYSIPHEAVIALNWPVLWFALGASVLTGIIFGIVPALQVSGESQADTLRGAGRGANVGLRGRRLHNSLIVAEVVLSLVLLTGAGLAVRGLFALKDKSLGYNPRNALTFQVPLDQGRYKQWSTRFALLQNIVSRLRRLPQVRAAAVTDTFVPPYGHRAHYLGHRDYEHHAGNGNRAHPRDRPAHGDRRFAARYPDAIPGGIGVDQSHRRIDRHYYWIGAARERQVDQRTSASSHFLYLRCRCLWRLLRSGRGLWAAARAPRLPIESDRGAALRIIRPLLLPARIRQSNE